MGLPQDLEIIKGYVPGYQSTLGHEFVGIVEQCDDREWQGQRVVGEINCLCEAYEHLDPVMVRNHAPNRKVLGIINKDGCMGQYITLPKENLHRVPADLSDKEACFAEPLAAACRIAEQKVNCITACQSYFTCLPITSSSCLTQDLSCSANLMGVRCTLTDIACA